MREFRTEEPGTRSLEAVDHVSDRPAGIALNKEVHMIRHDLLGVERRFDLGGDSRDDVV